MEEHYSSYEKEVVNKTVTIQHIVRVKLNEPVESIIENLKKVPPNTPLVMLVGDDENGYYGELIFEEMKQESI